MALFLFEVLSQLIHAVCLVTCINEDIFNLLIVLIASLYTSRPIPDFYNRRMVHLLGIGYKLTQMRPVLIALATLNTRLIFVEKIPPARPYSESLAILLHLHHFQIFQ